MMRFVGLRGALSDSHPLNYLWRRIAPWIVGRFTANRQAIAAHCEFENDFYLDASAFREKYVKPTFVSRYIFPGDHYYFCLHEFLAAAAKTPLDVLAVYNDHHNYYKAWAENLEAARDEIARRWGEALYRRFRLFLWGSAFAFLNRAMEACRVVPERPREAAIRPAY